MHIEPIAYYHSPFNQKFGIPKQSGLANKLKGTIEFTPQYCNVDFIRGLEGFDYIWLIWEFSKNKNDSTHSTVRPPVLGGNVRMGVFATRSPYRPNPIGLSSVRLLQIETTNNGKVILHVGGADLMDGTPIYDIKPYLPYADCHEEARSGFTDAGEQHRLAVIIPDNIAETTNTEILSVLEEVLSLNPRPHYHNDPKRIYGMNYAGYNVRFTIDDDTVNVVEIAKSVQ